VDLIFVFENSAMYIFVKTFKSSAF